MDEESQYIRSPLSVFTTDLYAEFIKQQNDSTIGNLLVSPVSIWIALSMMEAGSGGDTRKELISGLRMPAQLQDEKLHKIISNKLMRCFESDSGLQISFADRLFILKPARVQKRFRTIVQSCYKSDVGELGNLESVDAKRSRINAWIHDNTHRKIKELVPADTINAETSLTLINTVYFKGLWQEAFNTAETYDGEFHNLDGSTMNVKMMRHQASYLFAKLGDLKATVIKVPFQRNEWEMMIVLPDEIDGLPTLLSSLRNPGAIESILRSQLNFKRVVLHLPRFRLGEPGALDLKRTLRCLGINSLFESDKADLTGLCEHVSLPLSEIFHKAILEVDENGTRAAVDTAISVKRAAMSRNIRIEDVYVNHPFVLAILYGRSIPVFIGHVTNPQDFVA
ncbi:unnamed protein product [Calicophoron daubneyi]|uniref:Serpin domain-containing protein n=1 Tax=Calicophoron daubneyi TaxID=300641 RepID=A0AAV2TX16_CALDB